MTWDLPTSVDIQGAAYDIRTDYRCILDICAAIADPELSGQDKAEAALSIFYPDYDAMPPEHRQEAVERCLWFIGGGEEQDGHRAPKLTGQIIPAIQAVGGAIDGIAAKLAPVLAILKLIWDVAKKILQAAMEELRRFLGAVQKGTSAIWNAGGTLADWLSGGMKSAKEFGAAAVSAFTAAAKSLAKLMADMNVLTKLSDAVGKKLKRLGQMIRRVFVFSVITKGLREIRSQISAYRRRIGRSSHQGNWRGGGGGHGISGFCAAKLESNCGRQRTEDQ